MNWKCCKPVLVVVMLAFCMATVFQLKAAGEEGAVTDKNYSNVSTWDGAIDEIQDNRIVINDQTFALIPETVYLGADDVKISKAYFRAGVQVEFEVTDKRDIISLKLLK